MAAQRRLPRRQVALAIALRRAREQHIKLSVGVSYHVSMGDFAKGNDNAKQFLGELMDGLPRLGQTLSACLAALEAAAPDDNELAKRLCDAQSQLASTVSLWKVHRDPVDPIGTLERAHAAVAAVLDTIPRTEPETWLRRQLEGLGKDGA